jgi:hypothetical protein
MFNLAESLRATDPDLAREWYKRADAAGDTHALSRLQQLPDS